MEFIWFLTGIASGGVSCAMLIAGFKFLQTKWKAEEDFEMACRLDSIKPRRPSPPTPRDPLRQAFRQSVEEAKKRGSYVGGIRRYFGFRDNELTKNYSLSHGLSVNNLLVGEELLLCKGEDRLQTGANIISKDEDNNCLVLESEKQEIIAFLCEAQVGGLGPQAYAGILMPVLVIPFSPAVDRDSKIGRLFCSRTRLGDGSWEYSEPASYIAVSFSNLSEEKRIADQKEEQRKLLLESASQLHSSIEMIKMNNEFKDLVEKYKQEPI